MVMIILDNVNDDDAYGDDNGDDNIDYNAYQVVWWL